MDAPADGMVATMTAATGRETVPTAPRIVARYHGVEVPSGPHLSPGMVRSLQQGRFEAAEVRTALATIRPGDRVLELGAGSGAVGAAIALNCRPAQILSFEPNPRLVPQAQALHAHNGLQGRISVRHGLVLAEPDAPDRVAFFLRGNFLGSGLTQARGQRAEAVDVPVTRHAALRRDYPYNVLLMDIEGAERAFLRHADLSGVRLVLVELHPRHYGPEGMQDCRRALRRAGLVRDDALSGRTVCVFRRGAA
jgi:FkbM family methyltransferase